MTVTKDAASGKFVPANAAECTEWLAGTGIANPSLLYNFGEANGNIADAIGAFAGTAAGSGRVYQSAVAGWTRKGLLLTKFNGDIVSCALAGLPDIHTTSMLVFAWISFPAGGEFVGNRSVITLGPTFGSQAWVQMFTAGATPTLRIGDDNQQQAGAVDVSSSVRPVILQIDRTNNVVNGQDDAETITPTFSATPTGKALILGGDNGQENWAGGTTYLWLAAWFGAAAELDATKRALLLTRANTGPPAIISAHGPRPFENFEPAVRPDFEPKI